MSTGLQLSSELRLKSPSSEQECPSVLSVLEPGALGYVQPVPLEPNWIPEEGRPPTFYILDSKWNPLPLTVEQVTSSDGCWRNGVSPCC